MSELIRCAVCKKEYQSLVGHLRRHNLTSLQYREKFPGEKVVIVSTETRLKTSKSHWSKKPLNETQHIRKIMAENGRRTMKLINSNGQAFRMSKGYHTDEHKERMRQIMLGRKITWKDKIKHTHWSKKSDVEVQRIVDKINQSGTFRNTKRGWFHSKKMNDDFFFMSSYEERRMNFLENSVDVRLFTNKHNIWIDYQWNDDKHRYNPDLLVTLSNGTIFLEEIKGFIDVEGKTRAKELACIKYAEAHGLQYKMLFEDDLEIL